MRLARVEPNANAFTLSFDQDLLSEIQEAYLNYVVPGLAAPEHAAIFEGGKQRSGEFGEGDHQYFYTSYGEDPLFWVSNNNQATYDQFKRFFLGLGIVDEVKNLVDFDNDLQFYCGFFVVGDRAPNSSWHMDYAPDANAYTFIAPLFEPHPGHGNLLYKDQNDGTQIYNYKLGEGVIFGDHFHHSTQPYEQTDRPRVMLSFTVGTDKLEHWEALKQTIGGQSKFAYLPCGHQMGTCNCLEALGEKGSVDAPEFWDNTVPRNAPCPCGSGKRYKQCHGKL